MRDEFTLKTINILSKRCAYRCSNPECRKLTIGPNEKKDKATTIGVAAHITAASKGGPRYDADLTTEQRIDIDNGIWLCENCASLIDKDPQKFSLKLLKDWKNIAENEAFSEMQKSYQKGKNEITPILEAEIIWTGTLRRHLGYSKKNEEIYKSAIPIGHAFIDYKIMWEYELKIYNNSSFPAFNLRILQQKQGKKFATMESIPKINNIQPFQNISLQVKNIKFYTGTAEETDIIDKVKFSEEIQGLRLLLSYHNEQRNLYYTELVFNSDEVENITIDTPPNGYN